MKDVLDKVAQVYLDCFLFDVEVFRQPWIYWWLMVPATLYFVFFLLKWLALTAPLWIPLRMFLMTIRFK